MLSNLFGKFAAPFIALMGVIATIWLAKREGIKIGEAKERREVLKNNKKSADDAKKRLESMRSVDDAGFLKRMRKSEHR